MDLQVRQVRIYQTAIQYLAFYTADAPKSERAWGALAACLGYFKILRNLKTAR